MATTTEEWIEVHSPYNGEVVGRAPKSGADDARRAVDAAARTLESPLPAHERAAILDRVAALLRERHEDMARTICAEAGKPIKTARVEASRAVSTYTFAAVEARKLAGDVGYSFADIGQGDTPGKRLVLELAAPTYLAHARNPHVPHPNE